MAVPALTKTWEFDVNQKATVSTSNDDAHNDLMFRLKETLIAGSGHTAFTTPWTVVASSDGTTADATDNWNDVTDINPGVNQSAARSWIVLRQTGITSSGNFEICLDLRESGANRRIDFVVSPAAGFTGFTSTTARPTATDEITKDLIPWGYATTAAQTSPLAFHVLMSSDGAHTRIFMTRNGLTTGLWFLEEAANAVSGWTTPGISDILASTVEEADRASWSTAARLNALGAVSEMTLFMEYNLNDSISTPNAFDNSIPFAPVGLFSNTGGEVGHHGEMADLWFTTPGNVTGRPFPDGGSKQFMVLNQFIIPWNGTDMLRGV